MICQTQNLLIRQLYRKQKALDRFKFEVANELGVPLTDGYNGNLTSKQNGSVGGYMVKKIVSEQPLNFSSIFYIIPGVIVNYRTTFLTNQRGYCNV